MFQILGVKMWHAEVFASVSHVAGFLSGFGNHVNHRKHWVNETFLYIWFWNRVLWISLYNTIVLGKSFDFLVRNYAQRPVSSPSNINGRQPWLWITSTHRAWKGTAWPLFVPDSQGYIKWPDRGRPWATPDKVSGLWKRQTAQIQCNRRPKWPDNHISPNLSRGQTNARGVQLRQVAF